MDKPKRTRPRRRPTSARREGTPRTVAWVFAGGGPRGAFQAGAVKALDEAGIYPDMLLGTAVGAINACFYATGGPVHMEECWHNFEGRRLVPSLSLRHNPIVGRSLCSPRWLHRRVEAHVDFEYLQDSGTEIGFAALNLSTGRVEVLTNRDARSADHLRDMGRAAYAIPLLHPPVLLGEDQYVLGGFSGRHLVDHAAARGATEIYVLQCFTGTLPRAESLDSLRAITGRLAEVACAHMTQHALNRERRDALHGRGIEITVIEPATHLPGPGLLRRPYVRPTNTEALLEAGYAQGTAVLRQQRRRTRKIVPLHGTHA